jgi:tetratricopeptide (TPR) repeat protein
MKHWIVLLLLSGCGSSDPELEVTTAPEGKQTDGPQGPPPPGMMGPPHGGPGAMDLDQGQQHPPIPETDPAREDWDAGGFVSEYFWYGEKSWADVRMRLAGHLSVIGRDRARLAASQGDFETSARLYRELVTELNKLEVAAQGHSADVLTHLRSAAIRDRDLLEWLVSDRPSPPLTRTDGLDGIRQEVLGLERQKSSGVPLDELRSTALQLQEALLPYLEDRPDLAIDGFEDFDSRHQLRAALFEARMDSLSPLEFGDPWGYWEADEVARQASMLGLRLHPIGGDSWNDKTADHLTSQPTIFTVEGVGWLPTGDTLIDVAAQPGPMAIGTLMKLGIDDPDHRPWLLSAVERLNAALAADPSSVPDLMEVLVDELNRYTHGSRYYNIKQLRNEGVRVLARAGHFELAREVLQTNYPLHHHDWAVPNRSGILEAIDGRLLAQAGEFKRAQVMLDQAWKTSLEFISLTIQAEAAGPGKGPGARPPAVGNAHGPPPR